MLPTSSGTKLHPGDENPGTLAVILWMSAPEFYLNVRRTISEFKLVEESSKLIVAVSGGPDSMAMLHVIASMQRHLSISELICVSIDHGLRPESAQEVDTVRQFCTALSQKYECPIDFKTLNLSLVYGPNVMERARDARLSSLRKLADFQDSCKIALGHTADDRAETFLIRMLQGSGPRGLACMPPESDGLIRPLIRATREDVMSYIEAHEIPFVTDPSNNDMKYMRVRVRKELLPLMKKLSPGIVNGLNVLNDDMAQSRDVFPIGMNQSQREAVRSAARRGKKKLTLLTTEGKKTFHFDAIGRVTKTETEQNAR